MMRWNLPANTAQTRERQPRVGPSLKEKNSCCNTIKKKWYQFVSWRWRRQCPSSVCADDHLWIFIEWKEHAIRERREQEFGTESSGSFKNKSVQKVCALPRCMP